MVSPARGSLNSKRVVEKCRCSTIEYLVRGSTNAFLRAQRLVLRCLGIVYKKCVRRVVISMSQRHNIVSNCWEDVICETDSTAFISDLWMCRDLLIGLCSYVCCYCRTVVTYIEVHESYLFSFSLSDCWKWKVNFHFYSTEFFLKKFWRWGTNTDPVTSVAHHCRVL